MNELSERTSKIIVNDKHLRTRILESMLKTDESVCLVTHLIGQ
jgi:hypothetical protein